MYKRKLEDWPLQKNTLVMLLREIGTREQIAVYLSKCIFTEELPQLRNQALGLMAWSMGIRFIHDTQLANMRITDLLIAADKVLKNGHD
jgi:hypothetical protein